MISLYNFINNFKKDLISAQCNDDCKHFFFKSNLHLMVSLEIASSSILDEKIDYSMLKLLIPSSLGNKTQIRNILNEGVEKKFYNKRKSNYKLTKKFSLMITNWYLDNKSKFN